MCIPQIIIYVVREKGMEYKWEQRQVSVEPWRKHWSCCGWRIGTSQDEATLNSEKIKPAAIAIIELYLSEGISKGVSQQKILLNKKFLIKLVEGFMVDLKTFLGFSMPNQSCLGITKKILSWLWVDIFGQEIPNLHDPLLYCMIWFPENYTILLLCVSTWQHTTQWCDNVIQNMSA